LRVAVNQEDFHFAGSQGGRQINGSGCFAYAALLIGDCDDSSQDCLNLACFT
jgi:hypothetical protein